MKKRSNAAPPALALEETTDILKTISKQKKNRPALVIGFAAETEKLLEYAQAKLTSKGCDWVIANTVGKDAGFGRDENTVSLIKSSGTENWQPMSKQDVALKLTEEIIRHFKA